MNYNKETQSIAGIYAIVNEINGKIYVGKSKNIYKRTKSHIISLNSKSKDENRYLINSWHKYGKENFKLIVLEELELNEELIAERELHWINFYKTTNSKYGYNLRTDSSTKMIVHEDTIKLMKESHAIRVLNMTEEQRKKCGDISREFWKNNPEKKVEMVKKVREQIQKYSIVQFTKEMEFVKEYGGRYDIVKNYPLLYVQAILSVCNGNKASYQGYIWRYKDLKTKEIVYQKSLEERKEKLYVRKSSKKSFIVKDNQIKEYNTLSQLCKENNLVINNIYKKLNEQGIVKLKSKNIWIFYDKDLFEKSQLTLF
jgi:group I intron endonuclease